MDRLRRLKRGLALAEGSQSRLELAVLFLQVVDLLRVRLDDVVGVVEELLGLKPLQLLFVEFVLELLSFGLLAIELILLLLQLCLHVAQFLFAIEQVGLLLLKRQGQVLLRRPDMLELRLLEVSVPLLLLDHALLVVDRLVGRVELNLHRLQLLFELLEVFLELELLIHQLLDLHHEELRIGSVLLADALEDILCIARFLDDGSGGAAWHIEPLSLAERRLKLQ